MPQRIISIGAAIKLLLNFFFKAFINISTVELFFTLPILEIKEPNVNSTLGQTTRKLIYFSSLRSSAWDLHYRWWWRRNICWHCERIVCGKFFFLLDWASLKGSFFASHTPLKRENCQLSPSLFVVSQDNHARRTCLKHGLLKPWVKNRSQTILFYTKMQIFLHKKCIFCVSFHRQECS